MGIETTGIRGAKNTNMRKSPSLFLIALLIGASSAVGQDDTRSRIEQLQKQMAAMKGHMEAMDKELGRLKGRGIDTVQTRFQIIW